MSTLRNKTYIQSTYHNLIDDECIRQMSVIDVDLLMVKNDAKTIRFIECKREGERVSRGQFIALMKLAQLSHPTFEVEAYILTGNPPYDENRLRDLKTKQDHYLNRLELLDWFNFDLVLEDK